MNIRSSIVGLTLVALVAPAGVMAQEIDNTTEIVIAPSLNQSDAAGMRREPGFSPEPINAGAFVLEPSLSVVGGYDSNVFNTSVEQDDAVLSITPRLRARTNAAGNLFELNAIGNIRRFSSFSSENSEEYNIRAKAEIALSEPNSLFASAYYGSQIELRSTVGTIAGAAEPVSFNQLGGQLGAELGFGDLSIRPSVNYRELDYASVDLAGGGQADLSFRDTRRYGGALSVGYRVSGLLTAFGSAGYSENESTNPAPNSARDSQDLTFLAGVRGEITPLVTAEIAAGYRKRSYDLAQFEDFDGFSYRADVQWYATSLFSLQVEASQTFRNSGLAQVSGILSNRISVSGYYDPLRSLRLSANVTYEHNDFRDTDTSTERPSMRFAAQYFLNRNFSLGAFAGIRRQSVDGTRIVQPFTSFSTGIGITLTP